MKSLSSEEIIALIRARRGYLRERMNNNILHRRELTHEQIGIRSEYASLEVLLLAIEQGDARLWNTGEHR